MYRPIHKIDFHKFENIFKLKYPITYAEFIESCNSIISLDSFVLFFRKNNIDIVYSQTKAINSNYNGTYNFRVKIKNTSDLQKLNRTKNMFSYYGLSNVEMASIKAIRKAFEILETLRSGKQMILAKRVRKK